VGSGENSPAPQENAEMELRNPRQERFYRAYVEHALMPSRPRPSRWRRTRMYEPSIYIITPGVFPGRATAQPIASATLPAYYEVVETIDSATGEARKVHRLHDIDRLPERLAETIAEAAPADPGRSGDKAPRSRSS
jgi:hypothetical protein